MKSALLKAWREYRAFVLFLVILAVSAVQFALQKRRDA